MCVCVCVCSYSLNLETNHPYPFSANHLREEPSQIFFFPSTELKASFYPAPWRTTLLLPFNDHCVCVESIYQSFKERHSWMNKYTLSRQFNPGSLWIKIHLHLIRFHKMLPVLCFSFFYEFNCCIKQRRHAHSKWRGTCPLRFLSQVDFECSFQKTKKMPNIFFIFDTIKYIFDTIKDALVKKTCQSKTVILWSCGEVGENRQAWKR